MFFSLELNILLKSMNYCESLSGLASCFLILKYIRYNKLGNPALSGYYIFSTNSQITKLKISKPT